MGQAYSVGQVNKYIKNMFEQDYALRNIAVKGEISNCKYHTSGHIYFSLKDSEGVLSCVMYAGSRNSGLKFQLEEGQKVIVSGSVTLYVKGGSYQLAARQIELDGQGDLFLRFEQLKRELEEMGMFDDMYKQPIPKYVKTVGIVTAKTGAAIQDIINISTRRNPYVQLILYPAKVQGEGAAQTIVSGIRALEKQQVDVIIVGRGGGSIEDLWAFNEEIVARTIFDCSIPIISAVGHETDVTIADYVADLRAPTPSAAAELAVYDYFQLMGSFRNYQERMSQLMRGKVQFQRSLLERYKLKLQHLSPLYQIQQKRQYAMELEEKMQMAIRRIMEHKRHQLSIYIERMKGLSPLDKLNQGYSYVATEDGNTLQSVQQIEVGHKISVQIRDGKITAAVTEKELIRR